MIPILIDIEAYTGLSSSDTLLSGLPSTLISPLDTARLQKDAKNYGQLLRMNKGLDNPPTNDEHLVFLLMWLCRNIFCVVASKMTLQFIDIAKSLATDKLVSLGPIVLAHLYRAIVLILANPKEMNPNVPGPLSSMRIFTRLVHQL